MARLRIGSSEGRWCPEPCDQEGCLYLCAEHPNLQLVEPVRVRRVPFYDMDLGAARVNVLGLPPIGYQGGVHIGIGSASAPTCIFRGAEEAAP